VGGTNIDEAKQTLCHHHLRLSVCRRAQSEVGGASVVSDHQSVLSLLGSVLNVVLCAVV
jgi:hypothetical protein